jgi:hypothetical protein
MIAKDAHGTQASMRYISQNAAQLLKLALIAVTDPVPCIDNKIRRLLCVRWKDSMT